jgi:hypothetical protein
LRRARAQARAPWPSARATSGTGRPCRDPARAPRHRAVSAGHAFARALANPPRTPCDVSRACAGAGAGAPHARHTRATCACHACTRRAQRTQTDTDTDTDTHACAHATHACARASHVGQTFLNVRRPNRPFTWCAGQPHAILLPLCGASPAGGGDSSRELSPGGRCRMGQG